MKNQKVALVAIGACVCTALFYRQTWGVNILLFSLLVSVLQIMSDKSVLKNYQWILVSTGTFLAGLGFNFTNSGFAAILYVVSMVLSIYLHQTKEHFWPLALFHSIANFFSRPYDWFFTSHSGKDDLLPNYSPLSTGTEYTASDERQFSEYEATERSEPKQTEGAAPLVDLVMEPPVQKYNFTLFIRPLVLFIVFIGLYVVANDGFAKLVTDFFEVISITLILFLCASFLAMITMIDSQNLEVLDNMAAYFKKSWSLSLSLKAQDWKPMLVKEKEAIISFVGLNLLLVVLLGFEINSILNPDNAKGLSEGVHENIYAVIFSVVLAGLVTIYFFSGNVFFMAQIARIRLLANTWIALNAFLVLIGVYKTFVYIGYFGLTYKRLSVLEYLVTILTSLIIVAWCIYLRKGNWTLVNRVIALTYSFMILYNLPNWDRIMVRYNYTHFENHQSEYYDKLSVSGVAEFAKMNNPKQKYSDRDADLKVNRFVEKFRENGFLSKTFEDYRIYEDLNLAGSTKNN